MSTPSPARKTILGSFSWKRVLRSLLLIYAFIAVYVWFWSDSVIFQPGPSGYKDNASILKIPAQGDVELSAVYMPAPGATFTIFYCHANAMDLADCRYRFQYYNDLGFSLFSFDYRGYGTTPGRPTTGNTCRDADTAFQYLVNDLGVPANRIIIHGHSVGGGPALTVAKKYDPAGVIIESSFTSAFRVLSRWPIFPFDKFINSSRIARINCPLLVIHGADDHIIPPWHGQALYDKARDPKTFCLLPDASHNDIPFDVEEIMMGSITNFAATLPQ